MSCVFRRNSRLRKAVLLSLIGHLLVPSFSAGKSRSTPQIQKRSRQDQEVSAQLVKDAEKAITEQNWVDAQRLLTDAYLKFPGPQILFHLGVVAAKEGRLLDAHDLLRRYESDPASTPSQAMTAEIQRLLAKQRPPSGKVLVLGDDGAIVRVDGRVVGSLPLVQPLLVSPGESHTIALDFPEQQIPAQVTISAGRFAELRINRATRAVLLTVLPAFVVLSEYRDVPQPSMVKLDEAIEAGVQGEKKSVLRREIALRQAPELASCLDQIDCQAKLAEKTEVDGLIRLSVENTAARTGGAPSYKLTLQLLDPTVGAIAGQASRELPPERATTAMTEMLSQIIGDAALRRRGLISVRSNPDGAEVYAGERMLGKTPFQRAAWVGRYDLTFRKPGFAPESAQTEVTDGKTSELEVSLKPGVTLPPPPPPSRFDFVFTPHDFRPPRPFWRWLTGGAAVAAGIVSLGFGISGVAAACGSADSPCGGAGGQPKYYSNSNALGSAFAALGAVLLVGGGAVIAFPEPVQQKDAYVLTIR
ncbi:MAG: PEGA domain-containing protein [Polyangia bacterium]